MGAAEFVDHDGQMDSPRTEIFEEVVDHARFRHIVGFAHQFLPFEVFSGLPYVGEKVARIEHSFYVVHSVFIDRQAGESAFDHYFHHLGEGVGGFDACDVDARGHDFRGCCVAEFQNAFEHVFVFVVAYMGYLQSLREVIGGDRGGLFGHHFLYNATALDED